MFFVPKILNSSDGAGSFTHLATFVRVEMANMFRQHIGNIKYSSNKIEEPRKTERIMVTKRDPMAQKIFKAMLREQVVSDWKLLTLMAEVEAIIYSRSSVKRMIQRMLNDWHE